MLVPARAPRLPSASGVFPRHFATARAEYPGQGGGSEAEDDSSTGFGACSGPARNSHPVSTMDKSERLASVVVMEYGGHWPMRDVEERPEAASVTAIVQQSDERVTSLRTRAVRRLSTLLGEGAKVRSGVLVCSDQSDEETWTARVFVAKAMLASIGRFGKGRLVLSAARGVGPEARSALAGLAFALNSTLNTSDVSVSVSFS